MIGILAGSHFSVFRPQNSEGSGWQGKNIAAGKITDLGPGMTEFFKQEDKFRMDQLLFRINRKQQQPDRYFIIEEGTETGRMISMKVSQDDSIRR